jgi:hypothetical protein
LSSFKPGIRLPPGSTVGSANLRNGPRSNKGFQDVPLDGEIVVADGRQFVSELGQVVDRLLDPIVGDVVGRCFGAQAQVIADILLEKALSIMTTDHGVWKLQILDHGLKLSLLLLGDLATEDHGDLLGLADGTIGIQ